MNAIAPKTIISNNKLNPKNYDLSYNKQTIIDNAMSIAIRSNETTIKFSTFPAERDETTNEVLSFSYPYLGCYDISDLHLSGKSVVMAIGNQSLTPRFLILVDEPIDTNQLIESRSVTPNRILPLSVQDTANSIIQSEIKNGVTITTFPSFDESVFKYMVLTGLHASSQYNYSRFINHFLIDEFIYIGFDEAFVYDEYNQMQKINEELLPEMPSSNINLDEFFNKEYEEIHFEFNTMTSFYNFNANHTDIVNSGGTQTYCTKSLELEPGTYRIIGYNYKGLVTYYIKYSSGTIITADLYVKENYQTFSTEDQNKSYLVDDTITIPENATIYLSSTNSNANLYKLYKLSDDYTDLKYSRVNYTIIDKLNRLENSIQQQQYSGNILLNKKWAVLGDSFTAGSYAGSDDPNITIQDDGPFKGYPCTYANFIANRNNMTLQNFSAGGMTIAMPPEGEFKNSLTYNEKYKTIDSDVDYITLYYGINDSHHEDKSSGDDGEDKTGLIPFGDINDNTIYTFCGAWNVVLEYLITHYPYAHIGIIISNGMDRTDYGDMEIRMAKKWGVPYLDMLSDYQVPLMHRVSPYFRPETCAAAFAAKTVFYTNQSGNSHPSALAHKYQSTFIENFLRRI